jgi:hypothetical protein
MKKRRIAPPPPQVKGLATGVSGGTHHRRDLREDRADAGRDTRHDGAGGNGHETRHQGILDEVLTFCVLPDFESQYQFLHFLFSSPYGGRRGFHR